MFRRLLILFITVFVSYSCITNDFVDEKEAESSETESVHVETVIEDELILLESLDWSSPSYFEKNLDKKTPLPVLQFREVHRSLKVDHVEPVVAEVENVIIEVEAEPEPVLELESKSFLELIINSEKTEDADDVGKNDESEQVEAVQEKGLEISKLEVVVVDDDVTVEVEDAEVEDVKVEDVKVAVREVCLLECEAEGWLLDEITDIEGSHEENLRFKGRNYIGGTTVFSFYPYKTGIYMIKLRKSDFSTGTILRKTVKLEVVEYLDIMKDDKVEKTSDVVVSEDSGINTVLIKKEEQVETANDLSSVTEVLSAVDALESIGDCAGAVELIEDSIGLIKENELDLLYFRLGGLYESCSSLRDERVAVEIYKKIVDYYPVSIYWIEAKERIFYLERNFIFIR